jgi:hypothetical protein
MASSVGAPPRQPLTIPPLESGDRLTREEFERRFEAMPDLKKAELIGEIAASAASLDLHGKLHIYRRHGAREYLVWRVLDHAVDWFVLRQGQYEKLSPDTSGIYRSELFPGLWLDWAALVSGDLAAVLRILQQGIESAEHAAFVSQLQNAAGRFRGECPG